MRVSIGRSVVAIAVAAAVCAGGVEAGAASSGSSPQTRSRLDDGKQYRPQAQISETRAIAAAQRAATGDLNEVDLEYYGGHLAWNVDVGAKDVKVDASTGQVLDAAHGD
jgi:uncharacterized membrane protein YkoI